ncbi:OB-fold nucleic acid binding domain-containing protein [Occultella gossypii]|uniref:OB-fold nucleic acid binding domain-containing protein n=1 Tax=Occultella gossypii TaxID=2800820 RepID=A0ABS7S6E7_9MICO|nr:OB-fold nucleic acid binding domain-containing protein [Occultella gossypii]MBZ2195657.1 OB-fold nucleic acid binding domain-containing protein [Occultella gossypii]
MSLRNSWDRLTASQAELEADDERLEVRRRGTQPVGRCHARSRATVSGVVRAVTFAPAAAGPALVAELYDGSGSLDLVWLGRREIPGIEPGRRLVAEGMITSADFGRTHATMFNPEYRLLAPDSAEATL